MKLYKLFGTAAMAAAMFASCSEADAPAINGGEPAGPVEVTFSVSRGAQSRTALTETASAGLSDVWTAGDALQVVNHEGRVLGTVTLAAEDANKKEGRFSGTVDGLETGSNDLRLWYLGRGGTEAEFESVDGKEVLNIYVDIQSGKFADLSKYDVMHGEATVAVKSGNEAVVTSSVTLTNLLAMAHFSFGVSEGATPAGNVLTISQKASAVSRSDDYDVTGGSSSSASGSIGGSASTTVWVSVPYEFDPVTAQSVDKEFSYIVTDYTPGTDVYLALISGTNVDLAVSMTDDDQTPGTAVTGSLKGIDIKAGVYYNGGAADNLEGTSGNGDRTKPVTVTLAPKEPQRPEEVHRISEYYSLDPDGVMENINCVRNPVPGTTTTVQAANRTVDDRRSDHVVFVNADGTYDLNNFVEGKEVSLTYVESYDGPMVQYRGDCALVAKFILVFCNTLTYDLNGGSLPAGATMPEPLTETFYGLASSTFTFTDPGFTPVAPDANHRFKGWSTNPEYSDNAEYLTPGKKIEVSGTKTIYAVWQSKTTTSGGGTGDGSGPTGSGTDTGAGSFGGSAK